MRLEKIPLYPKISDKNLSFTKEGFSDNIKLSEHGVFILLSNISTMYLLKEIVINNENYEDLFWSQSKDNSIIIKTTKEFCYKLISSSDAFLEDIGLLMGKTFKRSDFIRDISFFFCVEYILDEIFLIRRFELGRFYLDRFSENLFRDKEQNLKESLAKHFEKIGESNTVSSLEDKLKAYGGYSTIEERKLIKNCFKYAFFRDSLSDIDLYLQSIDIYRRGKTINRNLSIIKGKSEKIFDSYFEIKKEKKKNRGRGI